MGLNLQFVGLSSLKSQAADSCCKVVYCRGTAVSKAKVTGTKSKLRFGLKSQREAEAAGPGRADVSGQLLPPSWC